MSIEAMNLALETLKDHRRRDNERLAVAIRILNVAIRAANKQALQHRMTDKQLLVQAQAAIKSALDFYAAMFGVPVDSMLVTHHSEAKALFVTCMAAMESLSTAIEQARSAPVQTCYCPNCEAMGKELAALKAQPAPVQGAIVPGSVQHLKVMMEESAWEGYLDLSSALANIDEFYAQQETPPAAQPAVPDAFGTREGEHPQYIQGWNDCRQAMMEMKK